MRKQNQCCYLFVSRLFYMTNTSRFFTSSGLLALNWDWWVFTDHCYHIYFWRKCFFFFSFFFFFFLLNFSSQDTFLAKICFQNMFNGPYAFENVCGTYLPKNTELNTLGTLPGVPFVLAVGATTSSHIWVTTVLATEIENDCANFVCHKKHRFFSPHMKC